MDITKFGQTFYKEEADSMYGCCRCGDDSGSCDWCQVYYHGPIKQGVNPPLSWEAFEKLDRPQYQFNFFKRLEEEIHKRDMQIERLKIKLSKYESEV